MSNPIYRPAIEIQRQQITSARDQYRQIGFANELDLNALSVQRSADEGETAQKAKHLELARDNAYAAARQMDEMLKKLPAPKPEKTK